MKIFESLAVALISCIVSLIPASARTPDRLAVPGTADTLALADTIIVPEGYELVDTVVYVPVSRVDTSLVGKSIFNVLPSRNNGGAANVNVFQGMPLYAAVNSAIAKNSTRAYTGYRVRIFFDNKQTARVESEEMARHFASVHPDVPVYRSYVNPYFKITVGDFRSKSEAMQFLNRIIYQFPKAFIVKENIEFPPVDKDNTVIADTIQVLRPLPGTVAE